MAYGYGHERWRKLYIRESTEDRLLPVLMRGLRDYLIRHADDDGTLLAKTEQPATDLARALGAHPGESELVESHIVSLLDDGYLSHRKGRLWITNLVKAQARKSPVATKQKRYRDKKKAASNGDGPVTDDAPESLRNGAVTRYATVTTKREEEKRREEIPQPPDPLPPPDPNRPRPPDPMGDQLRTGGPERDPDVLAVFDTWRTLHGSPGVRFRKPYDDRANLIQGAVRTHDVATCCRVLRAALTDLTVTGKNPDHPGEHRTIEYLFAPRTFDRLLRAADNDDRKLRAADPVARAREAQPDLSDYQPPTAQEAP